MWIFNLVCVGRNLEVCTCAAPVSCTFNPTDTSVHPWICNATRKLGVHKT